MKNIPLVFLCVCIALLSVGCKGRQDGFAQSVAQELLARSGENLRRVTVYEGSASEGYASFMPRAERERMYGRGRVEECFGRIEDYIIYISSDAPGELALFKCFSRSDTDIVAAMLLERADALKVALRNTPYSQKSREISVRVKGKYVMMAFVDEPERVCKYFARAL